jgi:UDP-N-acetylmuramoyl-tripeptide--D-alanyl-D-alanine ligase
MLELGDASDEGHRVVGEAAARTVESLVVVGVGARGIADAAIAAGLDPVRVIRVGGIDDAHDALVSRLRDGDVVLVKASHGIGLDRLVDNLRHDLGRSAAG